MGKSSLAQLMLKDHAIPYVSTDGLTVMLKPVGQPSFYSPRKSDKFFPYLELFISRIVKTAPDYIIEGDAFSPKHVKDLQNKYDIKCVFLTMSSVDPRTVVSNAKYDKWTDEATAEQLDDLCSRIVKASKELNSMCVKENIPCIDLAYDYDKQFREAYSKLVD